MTDSSFITCYVRIMSEQEHSEQAHYLVNITCLNVMKVMSHDHMFLVICVKYLSLQAR